MTTDKPQPLPAPDGWADAYRETMETVWLGTLGDSDVIHVPENIIALVRFAAEIRAGIAAGLIAGEPIVRVPKINVPMRDEQPRTAGSCCDHAFSQHHDLAGCAVVGCRCEWSKASLSAE